MVIKKSAGLTFDKIKVGYPLLTRKIKGKLIFNGFSFKSLPPPTQIDVLNGTLVLSSSNITGIPMGVLALGKGSSMI